MQKKYIHILGNHFRIQEMMPSKIASMECNILKQFMVTSAILLTVIVCCKTCFIPDVVLTL